MKKLLIVSTSTVYGKPYLSYIEPEIIRFFSGCERILFIPYARPGGITYADYTAKANSVFSPLGFEMKGIHEWENPKEALAWADGFFTGGGNTFVLLNELYQHGLVSSLREAIESGKPYMGTSAGSNITGLSIQTTNDMPIVYPPSFNALQLVPFNINPHYLDPIPDSKHMGETRETRIGEFHVYNNQPVVGIREGSALILENGELTLWGDHSARIFKQGKAPYELKKSDSFNFLMNP